MWAGLGSSLVGAGIGGAMDLGTSLFGTNSSKGEARSADKRSYQQQKKLFNYQTTMGPWLSRKGLEAAGYNPMLALSQGSAHMPSYTAHAGTPDTKSGSAASMARMMYDASINKAKAEIENIKQDTALKALQGEEAVSRTQLNSSVDEKTQVNKWTDIANAVTHGLTGAASGYFLGKSLRGKGAASGSGRKPPKATKPLKPLNVSTPRAKPSVPSRVGHSASVASRVAHALKFGVGLFPPALVGSGLGYLEGKNVERKMRQNNHWDPKDKNNPREKARRWWTMPEFMPF